MENMQLSNSRIRSTLSTNAEQFIDPREFERSRAIVENDGSVKSVYNREGEVVLFKVHLESRV
jgi:hypothetical protein